jgi:hypothetical protein
MKMTTKVFGALSILMLFFLTSCASTKVTGEWKDPNVTDQKFENILVMGVAKQPRDRRLYENEFVKQLKDKGVTAVASHTLIPHEHLRDREVIIVTVENMKFDAVMITRVGDFQTKQQYAPRYDIGMYDYYNSSFAIAPSYRTGVRTNTQKYGFQSNLYNAKTEKLVFSLVSDTYAQDNIHKRLGSYIKTVVGKLRNNDLI